MVVVAASGTAALHQRALMPMLSEGWDQQVQSGHMTGGAGAEDGGVLLRPGGCRVFGRPAGDPAADPHAPDRARDLVRRRFRPRQFDEVPTRARGRGVVESHQRAGLPGGVHRSLVHADVQGYSRRAGRAAAAGLGFEAGWSGWASFSTRWGRSRSGTSWSESWERPRSRERPGKSVAWVLASLYGIIVVVSAVLTALFTPAG